MFHLKYFLYDVINFYVFSYEQKSQNNHCLVYAQVNITAGPALFRFHPQKELTICTFLAYLGFRAGIIS